MSPKSKIALKVLLAVPGAFLLIPMTWGLLHVAWSGPVSIGNFPENVAKLGDAKGDKFSFALIGDREDGNEVFKRLAARARENGCAFMIVLGDIVHAGVPWHYRYFRYELGETGFTSPVFGAVGNHDVLHDDYTAFHRFFGPELFSFEHGGCLFVFMDNANAMTPKQIAWADDVLTRRRASVRHAFLLMHRPPKLDGYDGWSPVLDLVKRHSITAIYAAHDHSYRSLEEGGTRMIVTGGGGGSRDEPIVPYHYVQIDVDGDGMRDRVVEEPDPSGGERALSFLERALIMNGFCYVQEHPWIFAPIGASIVTTLMLAGQGVRALARRRAARV